MHLFPSVDMVARRWRLGVTAVALMATACGGGDDESPQPDPAPSVVDSDTTDTGEPAVDGDDAAFTIAVLTEVFGFSPAIIDDDQRACMAPALRELFPGGVVPSAAGTNEDVIESIDAAAVACGFSLE